MYKCEEQTNSHQSLLMHQVRFHWSKGWKSPKSVFFVCGRYHLCPPECTKWLLHPEKGCLKRPSTYKLDSLHQEVCFRPVSQDIVCLGSWQPSPNCRWKIREKNQCLQLLGWIRKSAKTNVYNCWVRFENLFLRQNMYKMKEFQLLTWVQNWRTNRFSPIIIYASNPISPI